MTTAPERQPETLSEVVNANIRAMAAYRGWTQLQFAARLGMGRVALNDRWLGRTPWTLDETERAAHVFRVRLADLCTARDSNPEPSDSCPVVSLADVVVLDERRRAA